jgi:hypothetical protein
MGGNLISAADGVDALDFNPAALAPLASREFTISGFNRDNHSVANYLGLSNNSQFDAGALSSVGIASPYPVLQGHLAFGVSFDRLRDYTSQYSFNAVNPNQNLFNTQEFLGAGTASSGTGYRNRDFLGNNNLAYALGLTYDVPDSGAFALDAPSFAGMQESGNVTTEGGLDAVRIGGAIDIAPTISLGLTANILFGTYDYLQNYTVTNVHSIATDTGTAAPAGFENATVATHLHQDQSGGSLKLGLLANEEVFRIGATIESPQVLHINETSDLTGVALFSGAPNPYSSDQMDFPPLYAQTYDIVEPWKFGLGGSVHLLGLTGTASVTYLNMSDLQFTNTTFDMSDLNNYAADSLRPVLSWQLGAEYKFPIIGLALRAGYSFEPSPYVGDPSNYGISAISVGAGIPLGKYCDLDAAWRHSSYHTLHTLYDDTTPSGTQVSGIVTDDAVSRDDIMLTLTFKY